MFLAAFDLVFLKNLCNHSDTAAVVSGEVAKRVGGEESGEGISGWERANPGYSPVLLELRPVLLGE